MQTSEDLLVSGPVPPPPGQQVVASPCALIFSQGFSL